MDDKAIFQLLLPQDNEYTPEAALSLFSSLANPPKKSFLSRLLLRSKSSDYTFSLETLSLNQAIKFYFVTSEDNRSYFESQILASYPLASISEEKEDYLTKFLPLTPHLGQFKLSFSYFYPLKTYKDFEDVDPISSILGVLSKAGPEDFLLLQLVCSPAGNNWQGKARMVLSRGITDRTDRTDRTHPRPDARIIEEKISQVGFRFALRIVASNQSLINSLAGAFAIFARGDGNTLTFSSPYFWQKRRFMGALANRSLKSAPKGNIINVSELASLWHLPNVNIGIPNITWGKTLVSEPPVNLPIAVPEASGSINFIARTNFKNKQTVFGIQKEERRRHLYLIGKTGTGKSTLIANMASLDMRNREGVAVIDPHGDLSEILLDFVPSFRINDLCYFDPSDIANQPSINILEVKNPAHKELVASGIVAIFYKLYSYSWGPRLEHILRNTLLSLLEIPNTTLVQVPEILTNESYRQSVVARLTDPVLKSFWINEFGQMSENFRAEAISPILNKVGQFVSSPMIRGIIGKPHSTIDLEKIMNEGKILIVNLSQGRLGEDNAALLGAMIITKLQLAAMSRINTPESERRDFFLYVDEFQNFATESFIKILSEARKYRLNLTLANQYIGQVDEDVRKAIFGNVGTLISFTVGAEDAKHLFREFSERYKEADLVGLSNYEVIVKLAVNGETSKPFFATTLPLPRCRNQNREIVLRVSRERHRSRG